MITFVSSSQRDRDVFNVLNVALETGPPVQDRENLRTYLSLCSKMGEISKEVTKEENGTRKHEKILIDGDHELELTNSEVEFLVMSLDSLLQRAPRTWLNIINAAYSLLEEK